MELMISLIYTYRLWRCMNGYLRIYNYLLLKIIILIFDLCFIRSIFNGDIFPQHYHGIPLHLIKYKSCLFEQK